LPVDDLIATDKLALCEGPVYNVVSAYWRQT
jgi:hypothetical protein